MSLFQTSRGKSLMWIGSSIGVGLMILIGLLRTNFAPFLPLIMFVVISSATGAVALTTIRSWLDAWNVWRSGRWWALTLTGVLLAGAVFDQVSPASDVSPAMLRGITLGAAIAMVFVAAGLMGSFRGHKVRTGIIAAMIASLVGSASFFVLVKTASYLIPASARSGAAEVLPPGPWQVFASPEAWKAVLVLLGISVVVGTVGAMAGKGWTGLSAQR
jgi:hypothetical protein